jgi:hypothetical protein
MDSAGDKLFSSAAFTADHHRRFRRSDLSNGFPNLLDLLGVARESEQALSFIYLGLQLAVFGGKALVFKNLVQERLQVDGIRGLRQTVACFMMEHCPYTYFCFQDIVSRHENHAHVGVFLSSGFHQLQAVKSVSLERCDQYVNPETVYAIQCFVHVPGDDEMKSLTLKRPAYGFTLSLVWIDNENGFLLAHWLRSNS